MMARYWRLALCLSFFSATTALAVPPPVSDDDWDEEAQLALAQAMVGEADWHEPDHVAIAFVLVRRWRQYEKSHPNILFAEYIRRYAASLRGVSERSQWVRTLPWETVSGAHGRSWDRVRGLVLAWGRGLVADPCPDAMHWGGTMDRPASGLSAISCGFTRNIFYAEGAAHLRFEGSDASYARSRRGSALTR